MLIVLFANYDVKIFDMCFLISILSPGARVGSGA